MTQQWTAWFDGATEPNPGQRSIGGLLVAPDGARIEISEAIGHGTNNEAEYGALIAVLRAALEHGITHLLVHGDSQLVIRQVEGDWECKSPNLRALCATAQTLGKKIGRVQYRWIPREENTEADALSVAALGITRESADEKAAWTNQKSIGELLGISAIAVGKKLDAAGFRENKRPTALALERGLARITEDHFGQHVAWHRERVPQALR